MASAFESFDKVPVWQRIIGFLLGCGVVGGVWFFMFYEEAVERHSAARSGLEKATAELKRVTDESKGFAERQREMQAAELELQKERDRLPTSAAAVDTMQRTFQLQARLVGLTLESWTPEPEKREDFYARMPVKVKATATWAQAGEFFRRVYELGRPVSIENLEVERVGGNSGTRKGGLDGPPPLKLSFDVSTYRFLTQAEAATGTGGKKKTRRKGRPSRRKNK